MEKLKKQKGITLIALVITIIILLILAGIVLNLTLGEHGILNKTEQGAEQYKISEILEKLELEKIDLYARKNGETPTVKEYVEHLIDKGIITEADVEDLDENTKNITVEGYVFLIEKEESGNIKITYQGKADNKVRIAKLEVTKTTINSISIKVVTSNTNGGSYKYSIKDITAGETSFTEVTTIATNEYTFTNLPTDHEYIIQVELVCDNGEDIKETETIKTEPPKVTSIILDKTEIELFKDETDIITAEVMPEEAINNTITWSSTNEEVAIVDSEGKVTALGEGVAKITATANDGSEVSASCNVTVTLPIPPTVGAGAETHTAKEIPYTWKELNDIAKVISDNYGEEEGKINNDTAEVAVVVNGEAGTVGIGDWTTVAYNGNNLKVRILGFNHDDLVTTGTDEEGNNITVSQYGEETTNTKAGISFEYVDFLTASSMNSYNTNAGGWGACTLRSTLNTTIYNSLENKKYIKEVKKEYISTYNNADSVTTSSDKLWLLSCFEVWEPSDGGSFFPAVTKEGEKYKYYEDNIGSRNSNYPNLVKMSKGWWLRTPRSNASGEFAYISGSGAIAVGGSSAANGIAPGFAI